jgi:uncharacterized repeat protein (TIGR03803 family)
MSPSSRFCGTFSHSQSRRAQRRNAAATSSHRRHAFRPSPEALETRLTLSLTALASFNSTNGANPYGAVIMDSSGNLYGTTFRGGASNCGTVFELAHGSGTITTLASFNGTNGQDPYDAVIMDSSGNLYGTTWYGGASHVGTVFELTGTSAPRSLQMSGLPSSPGAGTSLTFPETVPNAVGTTDTGYAGTVDFTSTDSTANLSAKDMFTAWDSATLTFTGFVLQRKSKQSLAATDMLLSSITRGLNAEVS